MTKLVANWSYPTPVRFGAGRIAELAAGGPGEEALVLSGPEGGLSAAEEQAALARGFAPLTLGPRVLRAETAALAALVGLAGG